MSLFALIDEIEAALHSGEELQDSTRESWVEQVVSHQIETGRNAGAFRPAKSDLAGEAWLFTGERLNTKLAVWNVLTAESARLVSILGRGEASTESLHRAAAWLSPRCFASRDCVIGECAHSFVAHLRYINATGEDPSTVTRYVHLLGQSRQESGRWLRFPFFYTVLTLSEIQSEAARAELRFAIPALRRANPNRCKTAKHAERRERLIDRVMARLELHLL